MSKAYDAYLQWKKSKQGNQFNSALLQAQRDAQLKKFSGQFGQKPKQAKTRLEDDEVMGDKAGNSEKNKIH